MTKTAGKPFTLEEVLAAARRVVERKGVDYVYPPSLRGQACYYADGGEPSCLVGFVIKELDSAVFERLAAAEEAHMLSDVPPDLVSMGWLPSDFWTDDAAQAMLCAQEAQDEAFTWGTALARAEDLGGDAD